MMHITAVVSVVVSLWPATPLLLTRVRCPGHIFQLVPRLGWHLLKKIGPKRAAALKEGRSGYDVSKLMGSGK